MLSKRKIDARDGTRERRSKRINYVLTFAGLEIDKRDFGIVRKMIRNNNMVDENDIIREVKDMVKIRSDDPERRVYGIKLQMYPHGTFAPRSDQLRTCKNLSCLIHLDCGNISFDPSHLVEIGKFQNLEELALSSWCDSKLSKDTWQLINLKKLTVYNAALIRSFPPLFSLQNLEDLRFLDSKQLPEEIWQLKSLKTLNLSCAETNFLPCARTLSVLPEEIGALSSLKRLNLEDSSIVSLPSSIGGLKNLEELDLSWTNSLSVLPEGIGALTSLRCLNLEGSSIASLPSSIGRLISLEELCLDYTKELENIPVEIGDLKKLKTLGLRNSAVLQKPLPEFVGKLTGLMRLEIFDLDFGNDTVFCDLLALQKESLKFMVERCPSLGYLSSWKKVGNCPLHFKRKVKGYLNSEDYESLRILLFALSCNRARTLLASFDNLRTTPNLWPLVLRSARCLHDPNYKARSNADKIETHLPPQEPDAIYQLLAVCKESFIGILLHRKS